MKKINRAVNQSLSKKVRFGTGTKEVVFNFEYIFQVEDKDRVESRTELISVKENICVHIFEMDADGDQIDVVVKFHWTQLTEGI